MKKLFLLTCAVFFFNLLNAQILVTQTAPGTYDYNSLYQNGDLHFYLYNDGYYSFQADNVHEFKSNANGNTVKAYHSRPYDADQVEELVLNTVYDGISSAQTPTYTLPNKVALERSWSLVNNEENFFILKFENRESFIPISGCVEFHFTNTQSNINGNSILDDYDNDWVDPNQDLQVSNQQGYTHKYVWSFADLEMNEQRFIYIPANCLASSFDIVNTRAIMKVNDCEQEITGGMDNDGALPGINNSPYFTLRSQVRNFPHDPNSIVTDPNCLLPFDDLHTIRYTIFFQNEGVDSVENVTLDFLINTPFHTIQIIESSDNCVMTWQPLPYEFQYSKPVVFEFHEIFLDGTGNTPPPEYEDTYGWVTFDVCFNLKVFSILGIDCAPSKVDITFDYEAPVTAENEICRNCGDGLDDDVVMSFNYHDCPELLSAIQESDGLNGNKLTDVEIVAFNPDNDLQIYPNPTNDMLFLNIDDFAENDLIKVRNTAGEVIIDKYVKDIKQSLNLSDFPAGVYYISLQNEKSVKTKSFVKL